MAFSIAGKRVIVLGDTTTHGGEVITASAFVKDEGIPVARVGDMVSCPKCGGTYPIIEGAPSAFDRGNSIARHGDKVACGATLISKNASVSAGFFSSRAQPTPQERKQNAEELCALIAGVMQSEGVQKALAEAERLTRENGWEYAGWIVETSPGVYEIPELHTDKESMLVNSPPAPQGTIDHMHTHTELGMESFSPLDREYSSARDGSFDMVVTPSGKVFQDRTGNNIVCDPKNGGPRICEYSGDDEFNPNPDDPYCW